MLNPILSLVHTLDTRHEMFPEVLVWNQAPMFSKLHFYIITPYSEMHSGSP